MYCKLVNLELSSWN